MKLPSDPNGVGKHSMEIMGVNAGEEWETARPKMVGVLQEKGFDVIQHVFQSMLGTRIDAGDRRAVEWGSMLLVPLLRQSNALIENALNLIAQEALKS